MSDPFSDALKEWHEKRQSVVVDWVDANGVERRLGFTNAEYAKELFERTHPGVEYTITRKDK